MPKPGRRLELSRRRFLQRAGATSLAGLAFPTIVPASVRGGAGGVAPGDKIAVALIGAGPQGQGVMKGFLAEEDARVVAVCDVKTDQRQMARELVDTHYRDPACASLCRLSRGPGPPGHRRRDRRHPRSLACPRRAGRRARRQGRLPGEADGAERRRGPGAAGRGPGDRQGLPVRHPAALQRLLPPRVRDRAQRTHRQAPAHQRVVHRECPRRLHRRGSGARGIRLRLLARAGAVQASPRGPLLGRQRPEDLVVQLRLRAGLHRRLGRPPAGHRLLGRPGDDERRRWR